MAIDPNPKPAPEDPEPPQSQLDRIAKFIEDEGLGPPNYKGGKKVDPLAGLSVCDKAIAVMKHMQERIDEFEIQVEAAYDR